MDGCDYCDEALPLWHRREPDEFGLEPAQFIPCSNKHLVKLKATEAIIAAARELPELFEAGGRTRSFVPLLDELDSA